MRTIIIQQIGLLNEIIGLNKITNNQMILFLGYNNSIKRILNCFFINNFIKNKRGVVYVSITFR
jgi:hypothetical protein